MLHRNNQIDSIAFGFHSDPEERLLLDAGEAEGVQVYYKKQVLD